MKSKILENYGSNFVFKFLFMETHREEKKSIASVWWPYRLIFFHLSLLTVIYMYYIYNSTITVQLLYYEFCDLKQIFNG